MSDNAFLTAKEAAQILKMHPDTICDLCKKGEFEAVKVGGTTSKWLIKREPFEAKFGKLPTPTCPDCKHPVSA